MGLSGITSAHFNIYVLLACNNRGDCEGKDNFSHSWRMAAYRYRIIYQAMLNDVLPPRSSFFLPTTVAVILLALILILYLMFTARQI